MGGMNIWRCSEVSRTQPWGDFWPVEAGRTMAKPYLIGLNLRLIGAESHQAGMGT